MALPEPAGRADLRADVGPDLTPGRDSSQRRHYLALEPEICSSCSKEFLTQTKLRKLRWEEGEQ